MTASVTSLAGGSSGVQLSTDVSGKLGTALFAPGSGVTPTVSAGAGATIGSSGIVTNNGEQWFQVVATGISATANYVEINIPTFDSICANAAAVEFQTDPGQGSALVLYLGTAGYGQFATKNFSVATAVLNDPYMHLGRMSFNVADAEWTKNSYTTATGDILWTQAKLRVPITNGVTRTFKLRSLRVGTTRGKGRICVISDDGYKSWLRLGVPIFEEYGIRTSCAIIADKVGSSVLYGSLQEFKDYVSRSHLCVAHGPIGGTGNVVDKYGTNAERIADINFHRDYLVANGLTTAAGAKCYIWPQGIYSATAGDTSLLEDMYANGYRSGRAATEKVGQYVQLRSLSDQAHQRLIMPIIGHTYAGATNTADDAAETTNISNITTRITALGAARADGFLMLHKVVGRGAATAGQIEIETDRLRTLAQAIRTEVDAERLEAVTMDAFV
jgi:hypothetical protein